MEQKPFILVRRSGNYRQNDSRPMIRIKPETYATLTNWAALTGKSLAQITADVVTYSAEHLEVVDEEDA